MKFHRHWASATARVETPDRNFEIVCYGGSATTLDDARAEAAAVAARAVDAIRSGKERGNYPYARGPLREEVLQQVLDGDRLQAVVTRNSYGSTVLNAAGVLFADIDYPPGPSLWKVVRSWFGGPKADRDEIILARVHDYAESHPGVGFRLYRTANGYRCVATHRLYDPASDEASSLLEALGSDPLYVRLCRSQESFRARLSPKFWRCGASNPPPRYPWSRADGERRYREWQAGYEATCRSYSTCARIANFGSSMMDSEVRKILELHDEQACHGDAPLA